MTQITNHTEYTAAVNEAKLHDYRYFTLNAPTISDEEYDRLYFAIQDYETAHPDETLADSPTQTCYSENGNGKRQVARRSACLSMKKIHDAKTMVKYLRTQQKACKDVEVAQKFPEYACIVDVEWKFDGDTVSLVYLNGRLTEATYGHGKELMGNDCMEHVKYIKGVPAYVAAYEEYGRIEIRGEVIINDAEFARYTKAGKSQRSTASSIMGKKVAVKNECERLEFHPFREIRENDMFQLHHLCMEGLEENGFLNSGKVATLSLDMSDAELEQEIERIVCEAECQREALGVPTDGLVFKFDCCGLYNAIGTTDHDAKYNAAFKFRPVHKAVTTYRGYHTTIGEKTGKVTYIADYDMVVLNGIECSNANCGSEQTFLAKNLKPGDRIQVSLHGDVIPHIDKKTHTSNPLPLKGGEVDTPAVEEPCVIAAENNQSEQEEPSVQSVESVVPASEREEEESVQSVQSVVEEDIDDSAPIPYTAPVVEARTLESEIICAPIITPVRNQRKPSKRNYRMVGEPRTRTASIAIEQEKSTPWFAYVFATLAVIAFIILCFAGLGAAVFFLPLLAGAFK